MFLLIEAIGSGHCDWAGEFLAVSGAFESMHAISNGVGGVSFRRG